MAPVTRFCLALPLRPASAAVATAASRAAASAAIRCAPIHSNAAQPAKVAPVCGTGPPPEPPHPAPEYDVEAASAKSRVARRRRQAEMLKQARDIRTAAAARSGPSDGAAPLKRRFWKDVGVREVDGSFQIFLDSRPLRHPTTKEIIRVPLSKPHLANAIALEWDQLMSAQQATKPHLIPLTSLLCRALDIGDDDAAAAAATGANAVEPGPIRAGIATTLLRYLDTDSLLCWAPQVHRDDFRDSSGRSLRDCQEREAASVVSFLTTRVWPGVSIVPVLDGESIMPRQQEPGTRDVIRGWILELTSFELAGLERAVLAGKSLLCGARLLVEWSEGPAGVVMGGGGKTEDAGLLEADRFGVEKAARTASLEVDWQISRWGEVEDTHDVEKEDVRRQLGSVVLLVAGTGGASKAN